MARGEVARADARTRPSRETTIRPRHTAMRGFSEAIWFLEDAADQVCCGKPRFRPPWDGSSQREVIAFSAVKKSKPCGPYAFASPKSDAFHPPNEWYATGTGIGTLMPIIPTCASRWKRRAAPPSFVKIAVPLP